MRQLWTAVFGVGLIASLGPPCGAAPADAAQQPVYANLNGEALLDNDRVFVQKFIRSPWNSLIGLFGVPGSFHVP